MSKRDPSDLGLPRIRFVDDDDEAPEEKATRLFDSSLSAESTRTPTFVVVSGSKSVGRFFRLPKKATVGRALSNDVQLWEDGVSRRHAKFVPLEANRVLVRDEGSSNGIIYEGKKVDHAVLKEGDRIQLGDAAMVMLNLDDVVEDVLRENLLASAASETDAELPSRRAFRTILEKDINYAQEYRGSIAVVLLKIDRYKLVVDRYGLGAGEQLVMRLARVARGFIQGEDTNIGRYDTDSVVISVPDANLKRVVTFAESVRKAAGSSSFDFGEGPLSMTISGGVGAFPEDVGPKATGGELIDWAELMLFRSVLAGRDRVTSSLTPNLPV